LVKVRANEQAALRQISIGTICVDTFLPNVALFLPFPCNKARQMAASGGASEGRKSADSPKDGARCGNVQHMAAKDG
jgi:hypothetical protein